MKIGQMEPGPSKSERLVGLHLSHHLRRGSEGLPERGPRAQVEKVQTVQEFKQSSG